MFKKVILVTEYPYPTYLSGKRHALNFLSEGVRCGLDKEKERMGHTIAYFPFALWIERSQMTPYHKKLKFASAVGDYY